MTDLPKANGVRSYIDPMLIEAVARAMATVALQGPAEALGEPMSADYLAFEVEHCWRDFAAMARAGTSVVLKRLDRQPDVGLEHA